MCGVSIKERAEMDLITSAVTTINSNRLTLLLLPHFIVRPSLCPINNSEVYVLWAKLLLRKITQMHY